MKPFENNLTRNSNGADDLFHKRKAKKLRDIERRKADGQQYPKALIICEDQKTESCYFSRLKGHYRLNTASIEICSSDGSGTGSIFPFAKNRHLEEKKGNREPFDHVYCVFTKMSTRHMKCPWKQFEMPCQKIPMWLSIPFHALNTGYCFIWGL